MHPEAAELETPKLQTANSPLAIVGIGCLFPKAAGPGFYWANVKHGADCITAVPPTHWDPADYFDPDPKAPDMTYARRGGFLDPVEFDPMEFGIAPRDIEATDTTQLLGLVAAKQALTDAGVILADSGRTGDVSRRGLNPATHVAGSPKTIDRSRVSVILGVTGTLELVIPLGARLGHPKWKQAMKEAGVPDDVAEDAAARIAESYVPWQENSFPGLLGNVVAGRIANKLDLGGTNCVVDAACASSLSAVHLAALELQTGKADVVVTGGADTFNDVFMYVCFSKTPALSPTGDAKPFDADGDGTILGEGLGVVVLKRLSDAERDGDTVYAVIRGIGSSSDGKGNAIYAPSAAGQRKCLLSAYRQADVTPDTIELVEGHGTGTKVGDTVEVTALTEVFGAVSREPQASATARPWCAIGSVKSQIGHTKAAAGSASLVKAALALYNKVLPPTAKVRRPVEPLRSPDSPFYVNTRMRPWLPRPEHPRRAAVSAFGFGGSNFHAVLEEHRPEKLSPDWDGSVELVTLGADTPQELLAELERLGEGGSAWPAFARFAEASRASFRPSAACRLCFAAHRDLTDLPKLIAAAKAKLQAEPAATSWHLPEGAHYGRGPAPGTLAVLFPGQGSQSVGMLRELACLFPEMLDTLTAANAAVAAHSHVHTDARRLSDRIYPPTTFDPERQQADDRALRDTRTAQPAIGAVSFGAWRVLHERFGLTPAALAGHSYGELVALAAAGRLAPADLFALSRVRGELMARERDGDPGSMLAVLARRTDVERVIARENLNLVVANHNAPEQTVLSGATAEVERAGPAFAAAGVKSARLPVAAAFHSPLVADAAGPFRAALDGVKFAPQAGMPVPPVPVFANTTAAEYPADDAAAKDLLANQLARPVAFVDQVRAMVAAGVRTFVEVGPGSVLTRLIEATLAAGPEMRAESFAVDASGGKRPGVLDLGDALARLAARGYEVRVGAWEEGSRCRPTAPTHKPGLSFRLSGANYVSPRTRRPPRPVSANGHRPDGPGAFAVGGWYERTPPASNTVGSPTLAKVPSMSDAPNTPDPAEPGSLAQALLMTQQSLAALQRMQEQTAQLHRQFLESQEAAQRTLQALVDQQQALLLSGLGAGGALNAPLGPAASRVPAPTPAAHAPRSPEPPAPRPASDRVGETLLAVVAEKTGYPPESLDLRLSLDADLGVDSIKRVEILSALREKLPAAPEVRPEHLGTLHTLQDVADFLAGRTTLAAGPTTSSELNRAVQVAREQLQLLTGAAGPATPGGSADVGATLLAVVAEKTGYPPESLDLRLSLDADLGVDSIKRVEILSALREKLPAAPEVRPEHLGTLHTLQDVADFLAGRTTPREFPATTKFPNLAPVVATGPPATVLPAPVTPPSTLELAAADTEQMSKIAPIRADARPTPRAAETDRGAVTIPTPARRPTPSPQSTETLRQPVTPVGSDRLDRSILQVVDLDPAAPRSRVPLPAGGEVWVVGDPDGLTEHVADRLAQNGFNARVMGWSGPGVTRPAGPLAGLILVAPAHPGPDSGLNRLAFEWLQQVGPRLRQTGRPTAAVFATVARLDGSFGLNNLSPDADPTAGGLAGIVKTARHEWPEITVKAIDLSPAFDDPAAAAAVVVEEVLTAGPLEVGIAPTHRVTLEPARTVRRASSQTINLGPKDVVLVTGGARGVTAEAAVALAESFGPILVLTGRTPPPGLEPEWLTGLTAEADVKKAIAERLGPDAGPRQIGEQYQKVVNQREIRRTLRRIEDAGAKAAYFPVNAADGKAVADVLQQIRVKYGPVTAVVHGAGVLADRRIEDLTTDDFDRVYSTKVDGLRNLLDLLAHEELKALVLFSSTTGRFGRTGQLAYAAANEVLNKTAQVEARRRPGCRVVAINWGPWEGGMVTPGLRKQFEGEGIGLIPLNDGALFVVQELNAAGKAVEVMAIGKHRPSGQPGSGVVSTPAPVGGSGIHPAIGSGVVSPPNPSPAVELIPAFDRTIDIDSHPVLRSHVLDGRAVLPMTLHLEFLAHAALHGHPGLVFHGFNDLRITQGVKIEAGSAAPLRALAGKAVKHDKLFVVPVELRGRRRDGREVVKSRAEILLVSALPKAPTADRPPGVRPAPFTVEQAYGELLFHGPDLHGIDRIDGVSEVAFVGSANPAPPPAEWFQYPLRSGWVADPLVLDVSFQMMILWSLAQHQTESLPNYAGRYRQFRRSFPAGPVTVVIRVTRDDGKFARADIDYLDADGQVIAQMQDYECMMEPSLRQAFRRNQLGMAKA
jgi:acyl transferase domain-containing protein